MRLDKFLSNAGAGSRSQVKVLIKKGQVSVNGVVVKNSDISIDEKKDSILCQGKNVSLAGKKYFMLHKPAGVVSATEDNHERTVLSCLSKWDAKDVFPVGRLDKDTTGLLLLTNDGALAHNLLSPKKHVNKTYFVVCESDVTKEQKNRLENGLDIGDEKKTLPAQVETTECPREIYLTIQEGRFHQVKRMLQAVGNKVIGLKRVSMGNLKLDEVLQPGEYRVLTDMELELLRNVK